MGDGAPRRFARAALLAISLIVCTGQSHEQERLRFYDLEDIARAAFDAGDYQAANDHALELLRLANRFPDDWNYGNAVHHGNLILGRIALRNGEVDEAKRFLLLAGRTPGSPQLDSFGPNMLLARELLEIGQREVVLQYFDLCDEFWDLDGLRLEIWTTIVKAGGIPDFGANLRY